MRTHLLPSLLKKVAGLKVGCLEIFKVQEEAVSKISESKDNLQRFSTTPFQSMQVISILRIKEHILPGRVL